ncbi:MAG: hypothetical protein RIR39_550 [Pseudomonadota bacterium]
MKILYNKKSIVVTITPGSYILIESNGKEIVFCPLDEFDFYWVRQEKDLYRFKKDGLHPFDYRRVAGTDFFLPIEAIDEIKNYRNKLQP